MAVTKNKVAFLTSVRKATILRQLSDGLGSEAVSVITREKERGKAGKSFEEIWALMKGRADEPKVGVFGKDRTEGPMYSEWNEFFKGKSKELVEVASSFSKLLSVKDDLEVECIEMAGKTS